MHNGVGASGNKDNPHVATPSATVKALNEVQRWFIEETRLGIPVEFTNEGIRGACYRKSTNFPAMISLGATWDRGLVTSLSTVVAQESQAVGYRNVYAPLLDLARDPRWGRVVECFGEDPYLVAELGICMSKAIRARGLNCAGIILNQLEDEMDTAMITNKGVIEQVAGVPLLAHLIYRQDLLEPGLLRRFV